ncbi:MAG TPA: 50S ribosomal protein L15 [Clostridiaceae bacterium]|nr:50S ribosomal protein L15 [Clostridiaceae bacterium]
MKLHELKPAEGSTRERKRRGRGTASGQGKTSGRGQKGQGSRSGGGVRIGFEGGQMPLQRRLPKRGFTPLTRVEFSLVNLNQLDVFTAGESVTPDLLASKGLIKNASANVKILGEGAISKALNVSATKFSQSAKDKIIAAGGTIEEKCSA